MMGTQYTVSLAGMHRVLGLGSPREDWKQRGSGLLSCFLLYSVSRPFQEECWQLAGGALGKGAGCV